MFLSKETDQNKSSKSDEEEEGSSTVEMQKVIKRGNKSDDWLFIARVLDRLFFIIFFVLAIFFAIELVPRRY